MSSVASLAKGRPQGVEPADTRAGWIDGFVAVPLAALAYALIAFPLILSTCGAGNWACLNDTRPENRVVWPTLSAIALVLVATNWQRLRVPLNIRVLFLLLGLAGMSVLWAFDPQVTGIRYAQQVMVITAVVMPALIIGRNTDLLRGLFVLLALSCVINVFFVLGPPPVPIENATPGHTGYFPGKNYLGICAAMTLLLAAYEMTFRGARRIIAVLVAAIAIVLLVRSNAKTAMGLTILCPLLATIAVLLRRRFGLTLLTVPLVVLGTYAVLSTILGFDVYRLSSIIYGNPTFTGRRWIWAFAGGQIWQRPLFGWGHQSFWLVGPDAPSVVEAPGWIKTMPNAHNGYVDTTLELGYVGLAILVAFIAATLHAAGSVADRDGRRGWILTTLVFFVMMTNGTESMWMRAFEIVWVVFLFVAVDIARQTGSSPVTKPHVPNGSASVAGKLAGRSLSRRRSEVVAGQRSRPTRTRN